MNYFLNCIYAVFGVSIDMVARYWASGESSLIVKGTLNPPVPALKAGHLVPTASLINVSVRECLVVV